MTDSKPESDFSFQFTENLPALFKELNISLAFTSYQAGRLMLVRTDGETLDVNFKAFRRPMGLTATEDGLTLGIYTQVLHFQREDGLIEQLKKPLPDISQDITAPRVTAKETEEEKQARLEKEAEQEAALTPEQKAAREKEQAEYEQQLQPVDSRVDACYITRSAHYSGMINIHDIEWGDDGIWAVNSSFSCLCNLTADYSFVPRWKPHFISALVPEDRCHLNGMALRDGRPAYVTTFSKFDEVGMWRKGTKFDGTLMDVASNQILVDGLAMPHSPRWHNNRVYFCNSGHGLVCTYDPESQALETLVELPGFTRGIDFYGPLMFVGLSKVRDSDVTKPAPLSEKYDETFSGIWVVNIETGDVLGQISFTGNVDQIYDIAVLGDTCFPEIIEPSHPRMRNHFCHADMESL